MSKVQMLRTLVNQRLTAAVEGIFRLFETTIAQYEEQLCRSKEKNERQRQLLDAVFKPRLRLHRTEILADVHPLSVDKKEASPPRQTGSFSQEDPESTHIKGEPEKLEVKDELQNQVLEERDEEKPEDSQLRSSFRLNDMNWEIPADIHPLSVGKEEVSPQQQTGSFSEEDPESTHIKEEPEKLEVKDEVQNQVLEKKRDEEKPDTPQLYQAEPCCETPEPTKDPDPDRQFLEHFCSECGRRFSSIYSLRGHIKVHKIHKKGKPFACSFCDKSFIRRPSLILHVRLHTGEKPYSCSLCKKCFSRRDYLTKHVRIHTGERPYRCSICKMCFTQSSHLSGHKRKHTGEKPYRCSVCENSFSQRHALQRHMMTHTGETIQHHSL